MTLRERCLFDTKLRFCQLQANSSLKLSSLPLKDLRRVNDNIKLTELDSRETAPLNSVATGKQLTLHNYLFSIFEVRFVLAQLLTKRDRCWMDEKYRYCFLTATRKMNLSNHKPKRKPYSFVICIHGMSFSFGLLNTNNRFHHADERIFFLFSTSPSINGNLDIKVEDRVRHIPLVS